MSLTATNLALIDAVVALLQRSRSLLLITGAMR